MRVQSRVVVIAARLIVFALLLPAAAAAAEIKLMCPSPMRTAMVALLDQFERTTPHKVEVVHTPTRFIVDRVRAGEAMDVTILTKSASDQLLKEGKLTRSVDIARSSIGIAVLSGAPKLDLSSAEAVKRALLAAKTFARNEGAESGKHMLAVFDRLGITEQMKAKTTAMPVNTGYVAQLVARRQVEMAAQQMPELMAVPGVDATPLPRELQQVIVFSAGVAATSGQPDAVNELMKLLSSPAAAPVLKSKGLDAF